MSKGLIVKSSIHIDADTAAVWDALVNPEKIKQYLLALKLSRTGKWAAG
jgi:uncharacterized protein YndB with AHSA1/START domain